MGCLCCLLVVDNTEHYFLINVIGIVWKVIGNFTFDYALLSFTLYNVNKHSPKTQQT